jgi:biotin transport system substrate-specific component
MKVQVYSLSKKNSLVYQTTLIFLFSFFMIVSSYIRIPLWFSPVPITLQTFVLYLSILFLKRKSFFSQVIYLSLGVFGIPVFGNTGAGLWYLFGPTGGYLLGFLLVSIIFPYFLPSKKSFIKIFFYFLLANFLIYILGMSWLIIGFKFTFYKAFLLGVLPFLIGDIIKIVLVSIFPLKR